MSALGSLVVSLSLEYAAYTKGLDKSSQEALKFSRNSQKAFDNASSALKGMLTGVLAAGAAYLTLSKGISAVNDSISGLANLKDLSEKTGSSVENLSKMEKVAKQFGGDFAQVDVALSKLAKGMASVDSETNKAHKALGALNLTDFSKTHDASEVMVEVAKRLQGYADGAGKAALATDLFGKSGADLIPYLNDLAEGYDKQTGASTKAAEQAEAFENKIGALKVKVGELFQNLAIDLLRTLNDVADAFIDGSKASQELSNDNSVIGWADSLALAGAQVYDTFAGVFRLISTITGASRSFMADITVATTSLALSSNGRFGGIKKDYAYEAYQAALSERAKIRSEQATRFDALTSGTGTSAYDKLQAQFAGRGQRSRNAAIARNPNASAAQLDYETGNAGADDSVKRAKDAEDKKLAIWQKAFDEKKAQDIKWFEDELELEEYYDKQLAKEKKETQEKWLELEQKNIEIAQKEREDALEKLQKKHEEVWNSIENTAHDVWTSVWQDGSNAFKNIGKTIKSAILDLLYQITVKQWIIGVSTSAVGGSISSAAASVIGGGASGGGSILSSLSGIGNLFSQGNSAIVSSIESLGTFLSTGTGGLGDMIGGALGQYASQISNVLPFAGAAFSLLTGDVKGAIGSALGAALTFTPLGPVGGIIGSLLGGALGGMFGGGHVSRPKYYANTLVSSGGSRVTGSYGNSDASGNGGGVATGNSLSFANMILNYAKLFGASVKDFNLGVQYQQKYDAYLLTVGKPIGNGSGKDLTFLSSQVETGIAEAFLIAIKKGFIKIPEVLQELVKKSVISTGSADIQNLASINNLYKSLKDLPPVFDAITYAIKNSVLSDASKLTASASAIGTYTSLFYTQQEQFDTYTKQITTQFGALNTAVPKTRDEFRELVDGIKVTDESSSNLFYGLVALAPAMDAFYKQIEALTNVTNVVSRDTFSSLVDQTRYQATASAYGSTFAADYTSNLNAGRVTYGASGQATGNGSNDLVSEIRQLRKENISLLQFMADTANFLRRWDGNGMPEVRTT